MAFIPVPNGIMVEMVYTVLSQRVENVYHFTKGAPANTADLNAIVAVCRAWEQNSARTHRASAYSLVQIDARALDAPGAPFVQVPIVPAIVGGNGGFAQPPFVTLAIRHITNTAGRSHRGRTYWIGIYDGMRTTPESILQVTADTLAGYYNTLRTQALAAGFTFVVASRYSGVTLVNGRKRAVPRVNGIMTPIVSSIAERFLDTNRHRKVPFQV